MQNTDGAYNTHNTQVLHGHTVTTQIILAIPLIKRQ